MLFLFNLSFSIDISEDLIHIVSLTLSQMPLEKQSTVVVVIQLKESISIRNRSNLFLFVLCVNNELSHSVI